MQVIKKDILAVIESAKRGELQNKPNQSLTVIIHQCNCFNNMGAGIAKVLASEYPNVAQVDRETVKGAKEKLGTFSYAYVDNTVVIVNLYSQFAYGGRGIDGTGRNTDYDAMQLGFSRIVALFGNLNPIFVMPNQIGCGLAKGDINIVHDLIEQNFNGYNVILVDKP